MAGANALEPGHVYSLLFTITGLIVVQAPGTSSVMTSTQRLVVEGRVHGRPNTRQTAVPLTINPPAEQRCRGTTEGGEIGPLIVIRQIHFIYWAALRVKASIRAALLALGISWPLTREARPIMPMPAGSLLSDSFADE